VSSVNLDHSTTIDSDEPVLHEPLRAKLAKWRKEAVELFVRGPAQLLPRATASKEVAPPSREVPEELPADRCAVPLGFVAAKKDLNAADILAGYRRGLLLEPHADRIGWLSPAKREVMAPQELRLGPPLRRLLREKIFSVGFDEDFAALFAACEAASSQDSRPSPQLAAAVMALHQEGHAHSIEVRNADGTLVGGLYGIAVGKIFFAEAKFEHVKKASTVALAVLHHHLSHWGFAFRSARWAAPVHLVGREVFQALLDIHAASDDRAGPWEILPDLDTYAWSERPRGACRRSRGGPLPLLPVCRQLWAQGNGASQQRA
jgi:leucyl/phenylalanyl-tRNA---protein transferase